MHYTYVLLSEADRRFYIGATQDLKRRVEQHAAGRVESTAYRRPFRLVPFQRSPEPVAQRMREVGTALVYYEACLSPDDAYRRERYLKSGRGGRYLRQRLASSLSSIRDTKLERH